MTDLEERPQKQRRIPASFLRASSPSSSLNVVVIVVIAVVVVVVVAGMDYSLGMTEIGERTVPVDIAGLKVVPHQSRAVDRTIASSALFPLASSDRKVRFRSLRPATSRSCDNQ